MKLGSSHQSKNVIDLEKKNVFNNRYRINYCKDFNYFEITESLIRLLDVFKKIIN
ncbi:hypothetical protein [Cetobacterium sp.]|uniref:hypothetical protein n=1 Tax=Cetobacterium sp. TaxID=2071632 RepID=UPI003EE75221